MVRPLSEAELRHRRHSKCHLCGKTGHWQSDHYSYRCTVCGKQAPGHNSGSQWCPTVTARQQDGRNDDDTILIDGDYDDWFGSDGEHNLNT